MITLIDLDGVSAKETKGVFINSASEIKKRTLDKRIAFTAAKSNGAINIWKDDRGFIRCESMALLKRIEHKRYSKLKDVTDWAKKWLKKIE